MTMSNSMDDPLFGRITERDFQIFGFAYLGVLMAVAYLLPDEITVRHQALAKLCDFVASFVTAIDRITEQMRDAGYAWQEGRVVYSMMVLMLFPFGMAFVPYVYWRTDTGRLCGGFFKLLSVWLIALVSVWYLWKFFPPHVDQHIKASRVNFGSGLGLALSAPLFVLAAYISFAGTVVIPVGLLLGKLRACAQAEG